MVLSVVGLVTALAVLLSDDEASPPPELLATATTGASVSPSPTSAASGPTIAPDGRTPDPALNALIETLLTDNADGLIQRHGGVFIQEYIPERGLGRRIPATEWAPLLAASQRSLYAVAKGHPQVSPPRDVDVVLTAMRDGKREGWRFAVDDGKVVDLYVGDQPSTLVASVTGTYEQFLVLPPVEDLPKPPVAHSLSTRTGDPSVDSLLDVLGKRDAGGLVARVQYNQGTIPEQSCGGRREAFDQDAVQRWIGVFAPQTHSLHAVARLPDGYQPPASHLVIIVVETAPYDWEMIGLLEAEGKVVSLLTGCAPYPPSAFLVAPPPDGISSLRPDRRSGHTALDGVLDALGTKDLTAFLARIDWAQVGCITQSQGIGSPPICRPGGPEGTLIDVMPTLGCEGHYGRRDEIRYEQSLLAVDWLLYAVVSEPPGTSPYERGEVSAFLAQAGWKPSDFLQPPPRVLLQAWGR